MARLKMSDIKTQLPKAYEQGWTEFYKLKFMVNPDVLIPRPETELLVDEALKAARTVNKKYLKVPTFYDIGTGSGCIAISIAKNLDDVGIVATDISEEALKVAEKNFEFNHVGKNKAGFSKIIFIKNDLLEKFTGSPDIIVVNLPYIPTTRLMEVDPMVTDHEPRTALDGGADGFELYRKMFKQMKESGLFPKFLIAEIDEEQGNLARAEARRFFPSAKIEIKKDLAKKDRILIVRLGE